MNEVYMLNTSAEVVLNVLISVFAALVIAVLLMGCLTEKRQREPMDRMYICLLITQIVLILADIGLWLVQVDPSATRITLMKVLTLFTDSATACLIVFYSYLITRYIEQRKVVSLRFAQVITFFGAAMIIFWFVCLFNNLYIGYTPEGVAYKGPMYGLVEVVASLGLGACLLFLVYHRKALERMEFFALGSVVTFPLMTSFIGGNWSVTPMLLGTTLALVWIYVVIHIRQAILSEQMILQKKYMKELQDKNTQLEHQQIQLIEQEKNLRSALSLAEHANKAKTNFLNSMSHDIRTPMNAIMGFTALATTHLDNKELVMDYLQKISTSSQHLLSLINDVLDMSRIESGVVKLDESLVHLPDIIHDLRAIIQGNILAKQHDLYIDTQNIVHEDIIADKLRLNQVLLNIVSNAIKFTPVGGMINIRIEETQSSKVGFATYIFRVKDNGIGISKEFQADIFDAFSREQTATKSGIQGTGLGMAISKNIINMMGGTITVNSELGKGSEFIVTVDFKISGQTVSYQPVPELQGARVLVVDDDANTCMSVCKMLRDIDMVTDWTTTGKEAVLRAKEAFEIKRPFRVFIIDWQMPDMNGLETIRRIRKVIGDDTPIIILTAYDWADIEQEAKEAGVTAFVSKPLFMSELRAALMQRKVEPRTVAPIKKYNHQGRKVLLVEDNELNSEIATTILEEAGLKVDVVPDGIDAVERMVSASPGQYDVILMDIQMPKMDGYTATREIRTLPDNKKANIPIIAMTANAFDEDKEKAFKSGMNGHISKPIDINTIMAALDSVF